MAKSKLFLLMLVGILFFSENCFAIPFERKLRKENECAEYAAIADAYYEQKNYRKASEYYEKARKAPKFYDAMTYKLACSKALGGEYVAAKDLFAELLAKEPSNRTLRESLAYSTVMSGELTAGAELYESLVIENPEDGNIRKKYIKVLIASKQFEKASKHLDEYEKLFGQGTDTESLRDKIKSKKAETEAEAAAEAEKAEAAESAESSGEEAKESDNTESSENAEKTAEKSEEKQKQKKEEPAKTEEPEEIEKDLIPDFTQDFDD